MRSAWDKNDWGILYWKCRIWVRFQNDSCILKANLSIFHSIEQTRNLNSRIISKKGVVELRDRVCSWESNARWCYVVYARGGGSSGQTVCRGILLYINVFLRKKCVFMNRLVNDLLMLIHMIADSSLFMFGRNARIWVLKLRQSITRVILAPNDVLTPIDLRAQISRIN